MPPHPPDDSYPRPQLVREGWTSLDGPWAFAHDDDDRGLRERWYAPDQVGAFDRRVVVPFPPESAASGIGDTGYHPVVWYRRPLRLTPRPGRRTLLHLGAVDHEADVWVDGQHVGRHEGGYTAFTLDVTDALDHGDDHVLVVRAHDEATDPHLARGKQDWELEPHVVWYRRSTGIWRTVWVEEVADQHVADLAWSVDVAAARVVATLRLAAAPAPGTTVGVELRHEGTLLAAGTAVALGRHVTLAVDVPALRNGQAREPLLWSPENPVLVGARLVVTAADATTDVVASYVGLRTVAARDGQFLLNGRPYPLRAVLEQGYWPDSLYTPPDVAAMRREVELIRDLGFNAARLHQKVEDPRLLAWADRLGVLLWAEMPSAYAYTPDAGQRLLAEWLEAVQQQRNHPSVVTWVPLNESWGAQDVATDPAQQAFARALADATRALDPSRPVLSNDGWEHQGSDILGVHDYEGDGRALATTYGGDGARARLLSGLGPAGRPLLVAGAPDAGQPMMLTEFGGIDFRPAGPSDDGWGYTSARDEDDWIDRVTALYDAVRSSPVLVGSCYTQLTDTAQETNGLCTADRRPKAPVERIRRAVTGTAGPA
ncbi:MAG: glycoside hydrolase [Cellulomonas sp. 73-92]|uniref:glycoside hydrolase family 2 protein n=1 Tax=Cellulomonas sp. 73-92 TaxID=1895740 RepID=UPI00092695CF|nr:glycoside hydrolase family 2 TIM barrel-domain containing protein [Cellulomonas sp. 73-92]OJV76606.1 MAG: glycoside hydrolase [Cellulomonas sp. 73-92]